MKNIIVCCVVMMISLAACTQTQPNEPERNASRREFYPVYVTSTKYDIQAYADAGFLKSIVTVLVNGEVVIQQPTKGLSFTQTFNGSYEGKPVYAKAMLNEIGGIITHTTLEVYVDGVLAATLRTRPGSKG